VRGPHGRHEPPGGRTFSAEREKQVAAASSTPWRRVNRLDRNSRGKQLTAQRGVKVDNYAARVPLHDVAGLRPTSGLEGEHDALPDFVATPEDRRPQCDDEVTGGDPFGREPGHRVCSDSGGDPPPSGVDGRHRSRVTIHEQNGNAVSGPHDRNRTSRAVPNWADRPVGRRRAAPPRFGVDDEATVYLPKQRRLRVTKSGRAQKDAAPGPRGPVVAFDLSKIEVRTSEGDPRAERVSHAGDFVEGRAAREPHTVDILEAPTAAGHDLAYFDDERLLIVAWISAASLACGSRSTYF